MGWPYWLVAAGADDPPLWIRFSSSRFSWLVVLSPELATARRDLPCRAAMCRVARLALFFDAIGFIGAAVDEADGDGAAGAVAAGARGAEGADGVIGALVCAQTGATIARAAAIATPFKRCFMPLSSVAVPDGTIRGKARSTRGWHFRASGQKQRAWCFVPANTQLGVSRIRPRRRRIIYRGTAGSSVAVALDASYERVPR